MSSDSANGLRTVEDTLNVELARILRESFNLDASPEVIVDRLRLDVVVELDYGPVAIEAEFHRAANVDDEAVGRLGLDISGRPIANAFALVYPAELRGVRASELGHRLTESTLIWRMWSSPSEVSPIERGSIRDLASAIRQARSRVGYLEDAVAKLDEGARAAGSRLTNSAGALASVARVFQRDASAEVANMAALMCINALVFHDRLYSANVTLTRPPRHSQRRHRAITALDVADLADAWSQIKSDINYEAIFEKPVEVLNELPNLEAIDFLAECVLTANELAGMVRTAGHDLAGQVFNRLVSDRKFLAAYYTSLPAAGLLAGLTMAPELWENIDWSDAEHIRQFKVLDPACGTGTLLMAAYQQLLQNHYAAAMAGDSIPETELHRILIEHVINGADVVDAAIHMTASALAAMSPSAIFNSMNLHVFPLGPDPTAANGARVGSLEWLDGQPILPMFTGAAQTVSPRGAEDRAGITPPAADLVIANPPFRRHNSNTGPGDFNTRVFGHLEEGNQAVSNRLSELLRGSGATQIAGLGSAFMLLAHRVLKPGGRIAFVLPSSCLTGASWRGTRAMLAAKYQIEWVITSHDPDSRSLSYDTNISETLVIARKLHAEEPRRPTGRFANLWRSPRTTVEGAALHRALARTPAVVHRVDGPPVGGSELVLGSDKWGEVIDAPIDASGWTGANWRSATLAQFASAIGKGQVWSADATTLCAKLPMTDLGVIATLSPHHLQIRGNAAPFNVAEGCDPTVQYPAMWRVKSAAQRTMDGQPDARLLPKPQRDVSRIWQAAGRLHVAPDVRFTSQSISAILTDHAALGVRGWYTLRISDTRTDDTDPRARALLLWWNSTLGTLLFADRANRTQFGRGMGGKTIFRTLPTLDVTRLQPHQLAAAGALYQDLRDTEFQPFYRCAIDPARIDLDQRFLTEVLDLDASAVDAVARIRELLAQEPSIHGSKPPALRT